jgi:hypothetical protein
VHYPGLPTIPITCWPPSKCRVVSVAWCRRSCEAPIGLEDCAELIADLVQALDD